MRHKYNTTAAYQKIFFGGRDLVNQRSLSHIKRTLKKNLLQLALLLISNQATLYNNKIAAYQLLLCSVHSLPSR
jgi:hypothetical protein